MWFYLKKCFLVMAALIMSGLLITACDTPLALGGKVNTEVPVIKIPAAGGRGQPGSYLEGDGKDGENRIMLDVTQNFGIDHVYMTIEYELLDEFGKPSGLLTKEDVPASLDKTTGLYYVDVDTIRLKMADGQFKTWVTAVDVSGKKTTTTDIIYVVKNLPPQIELTVPSVKGANFDSINFLTGLPKDDPVYVGFDLMGLATDNLGIESGYPKIMIWPRGEALDSNGEPVNAQYRVWRSAVLPKIPAAGEPALTVTRFTWPMVKLIADSSEQSGYRLPKDGEKYSYLDAGLYQFRIWTMDIYGKSNYYPNRIDNERGPNKTRLPADTHELKYIEIDYIVADIPIVTIREIPLYFNGLEPFTVKVDVTTSNRLDSVQAFVRYKYLDAANTLKDFESPYYSAAYIDKFENTSNYEFTITETMAALWPMPAGGHATVHFAAMDEFQKQSPPAFRGFTYDTEPPEVKFSGQFVNTNIKARGTLRGGAYEIYNPASPPRWVTGRITVSGTSYDEVSGIAKVYYHIGKLGDDKASEEGRRDIYKNTPWIDTGLDVGAPRPGWSGNPFAWNYTYNFNDFRDDPALRNMIQLDTELGYADDDPDYGTTMNHGTGMDHSARFYLPFYVKVLNNAGNQTVIHYKLCIDPGLDIPLVNINYPAVGDLVGGEVRLSGTAADNEWLHTVLIRIKKEGEKGWYIPAGAVEFTDYPAGYNTGNPIYETIDKDGWFKANKIGSDMVVGWYHNINGDTGLNPVTGDSVKVTIEVRAIDAKPQMDHTIPDRLGRAETLVVYFSSKVPTISNPKIKKDGIDEISDYTDGIVTSSKFTVTAIIADNDSIRNVNARFDRNAPLTDIIKDGSIQKPLPEGWQVTPAVSSGREYTLTFTIDSITNNFYPVAGYGNTGYLNMELTVENGIQPSPFRTTRTYTIGVDNFYPNAEINTHNIASGTSFLIEGTARDYRDAPIPAIQEPERVLIYFEKAEITYSGGTRTVNGTGIYLNPRGRVVGQNDDFYNKAVYTAAGLTWHTTIPEMDKYPNVRDSSLPNNPVNGLDGPNVPELQNFPVLRRINKGGNIGEVWESPHAMVIDNQELGADVDSDNDGTFGERWSGFSDREWGVRMDTTVFDDGPLMVHYIVMDQAGNAAHYKRDIYVENRKPVIQSINLGTDIDGTNNIRFIDFRNHGLQTEDFTVRETTSGNREISLKNISDDNAPFRIWNDEFKVRIAVEGGNSEKKYRLSHVEEDGIINAAAMKRGEVYTIESQGTTEWQKYGAVNGNRYTTFVATGAGKGNGSVKRYKVVDGKTKTGSIGSANTIDTTIGFSGAEFTGIADGADQLFIIKIFDSAVTSVDGLADPPEADQLAHAVLVRADIENSDLIPPAINAAPLGSEYVLRTTNIPTRPNTAKNSDWVLKNIPAYYYDNNIVTDNNAINAANPGARHGYVQYSGDSVSGAADISGKVIFIGKAADNQRINGIRAAIPGYNKSFEIARWDGTASINGAVVSASTEIDKSIDYMAANDVPWAFEVIHEELTLEYGHVLVWRFAWDSSTISTIVADDADIEFGIYDAGKKPGPNETLTPPVKVDIVPYISEVVTNFSGIVDGTPSAFARSARGWYPVREDDNIRIKGFNLGGMAAETASSPRARIRYEDGATVNLATIADASKPSDFPVNSNNNLNVNVGSAANSGALEVVVGGNTAGAVTTGGIISINNNTTLYSGGTNKVAYNWEPNNLNNNNLSNRRNLYIWSTGYIDTTPLAEEMLNPFMRMDNTGRRLLGYGHMPVDGNGSVKIRRDNTAPYATTTNANRYVNATVGIGGSNNSWYILGQNIIYTGGPFKLGSGNAAGNGMNNSQDIIGNAGSNSARFKVVRIAVQPTNGKDNKTDNNADRILVCYSDNDNNNRVEVIYGNSGAYAIPTAGTAGTGAFTTSNAARVVANNTTVHRGGAYTAAGFLSNGLAVVAWYDETANNLVISYGHDTPTTTARGLATSRVNTTTEDWQANAVVLDSNRGHFVDMAIDAGDNIHLAYYDVAKGGLYYAHIPPNSASGATTRPNISFNTVGGKKYAVNITPVRVDTYLSAGTKLAINVRKQGSNYVPFISYAHGSFPGTRNTVRIAWRANFDSAKSHGTDNDIFNGNWEVMTVPVSNVIPNINEYICNGVPAEAGNWQRPTGGAGGTSAPNTIQTYSHSYGDGIGTKDISHSVLVSYATNYWYSGSLLKHYLY